MTTEMNNLFAGQVLTNSTAGGTLAGTQQLTNTASVIAESILATINGNIEAYAEIVKNSQSDSNALDKLINDLYAFTDADYEFLKAIDTDTLDSMLKSQQSKRSRCKSREMTIDNYKSMMTAAIAETMIRLATGKDKGVYNGRSTGDAGYTPERLAELANDQDALRKEIRNVQSKKSILKSKANFTEDSDRWRALITAEEQLKSIRSDGTTTVRQIVDPLRDQLTELLAEVDEQSMTAKQLKELVASIKSYVWPVETEDNNNEDQAL
jgi:hypothetical protein